jgi:hypothetical protein
MESFFKIKDKETFFKIRRLDRYMTGHKGFIAGGVFKNIFNDEKFRDVDIFFKSQEDFNEADKFYSEDKENWSFVYENANAKCFKNKLTKVKIEIVRNTFSDVEDMLKRFDFTIVKFAYFKDTQDDETVFKCMFHENFFEDLINKKLVIDDTSSFPVNTLERSWKYKGYGYGLCRESKIKLINILQGVNPDDIGNDLYFGFD